MVRVRWLNGAFPFSLRSVAARLRRGSFTEISDEGFILKRVRDNALDASYVERINFQEIVVDPFGRESVFDRVSYKTVDFSFTSAAPTVTIRNTHRSLNAFVSRLGVLLDFSVSIAPLTVNLFRWTREIEKTLKEPLIVEAVSATRIDLGDSVVAKAVIRGGTDVRKHLDEFLGRRPFRVDSLSACTKAPGRPLRISLSSSCAATFTANSVDVADIESALKTALEKAL